MSVPMFITVTKTGDIWASIDPNFVPAGTVAATYKINSTASTQKVGTITGAGSPNYLASNGVSNNHSGKENT